MSSQQPSPFALSQLPPVVHHTYDFLRHFALFFLLPFVTVVFSAYIAAVLVLSIRRAFAPYATPEELLNDALNKLKKNEQSPNTSNRPRERALDTLRLVIQLRPDMMEPYIVLATELFYEDIKSGLGESEQRRRQKRNTNDITALRRREVQTTESQKSSNNLAPTLSECQDIIQQGLDRDPKNDSLLKLQNEMQLVKQYGRDGSHAKMMNIGSFGWMRG